ncbi:hypothetical protein Tco_1014257 [Tanacetum coccineum]
MHLIKDQNGHSDLETGIRRLVLFSGKFVMSSHHATIDEALLDNELLHVSFLSIKQCFIPSSDQIIEALRIEPVFGLSVVCERNAKMSKPFAGSSSGLAK